MLTNEILKKVEDKFGKILDTPHFFLSLSL